MNGRRAREVRQLADRLAASGQFRVGSKTLARRIRRTATRNGGRLPEVVEAPGE